MEERGEEREINRRNEASGDGVRICCWPCSRIEYPEDDTERRIVLPVSYHWKPNRNIYVITHTHQLAGALNDIIPEMRWKIFYALKSLVKSWGRTCDDYV
jgi:hypothetical protein